MEVKIWQEQIENIAVVWCGVEWSTEFEGTAQQAETVRPFPAPTLPRFEQHGRIIIPAKMM